MSQYPGYQGGYPPQQGGYPPQPAGYPPQQGGYPPAPQGYPPQQGGYPPAPQGYPPQQGAYPPQQGQYPPQQGGYPPQQGSYPPQQGGYPPAPQGYPPAPAGYPPQPAGYPPQQGGYPPAGAAYPPQQGGYPQGYPPQQGGYPQQGQYPPPGQPMMGGYPPQQGGYPQQGYGAPAPYQPAPYAAVPGRPAAVLTPSEVERDALMLRNALSGMGTDERALIEVVTKRTPMQMEQISAGYQKAFGKTLWKAIDEDVSGNFQTMLEAIIKPLPDFECKYFFRAMEGAGTNEGMLIELLVGRTNAQITTLKQRYQMIYGRPLEGEIKGETSGDLKRFFTAVLSATRDEMGTANDVNSDVEALYKAGPGKIGTDEKTYIHILTSRSYPHLFRVAQAYRSKYGKDLEHHIKKEFSGNIEDALVATVRYASNPGLYVAGLLHSSMAGIGTNDSKLIRLMARFFHHVLPPNADIRQDIKNQYSAAHGKSLQAAIESDTSGDFRKLLVAILNNTAF